MSAESTVLERARPSAAEEIERLRERVCEALRGKPLVVRHALAALLAGGHLLIEDVPGVGKTTLAKSLARAIGASYTRVQFTSDLMPSDLTGVSVFDADAGRFEFRPGPLFTSVLLADEINRATPKTQSALLEAMSEGAVSVDGVTRELPAPHFVVATQNPLEQHGTFPLPESQLDRFMMRLSIGYPDADDERAILVHETGGRTDALADAPLFDGARLAELQRLAASVRTDDDLLGYAVALVRATRALPDVVTGVSPRGSLALAAAARAWALLDGRDYAVPGDVKAVATAVLAHRIVLRGVVGGGREASEAAVREVSAAVPVPR